MELQWCSTISDVTSIVQRNQNSMTPTLGLTMLSACMHAPAGVSPEFAEALFMSMTHSLKRLHNASQTQIAVIIDFMKKFCLLTLKQSRPWRDAVRMSPKASHCIGIIAATAALSETYCNHKAFWIACVALLLAFDEPIGPYGFWIEVQEFDSEDVRLLSTLVRDRFVDASTGWMASLLTHATSMAHGYHNAHPFPAYWSNKSGAFNELVDTTEQDSEWILRWLKDSSHETCKFSVHGVEIQKAERVEHSARWRTYAECARSTAEMRHRLGETLSPLNPEVFYLRPDSKQPPRTSRICATLDKAANERFLFHGTDAFNVGDILHIGLDPRTARSGRYGYGTYFAEEACKAIQYTQLHSMALNQKPLPGKLLLCRVALGDVYYVNEEQQDWVRPPKKADGSLYEAVVANTALPPCVLPQIHREFIVYSMNQVYVEFVITFA
eukprot:TRINITY_DN57866_c0_g1_i1.p1 TRINITY_DN57866_c0_g1~~TRINITY_DN57866_c0_g1_i1.p1  ORF type:complete len:483 (-),score=53.43 TRINITY_DN57866_c0_g1_i1:80-1399(-)